MNTTIIGVFGVAIIGIRRFKEEKEFETENDFVTNKTTRKNCPSYALNCIQSFVHFAYKSFYIYIMCVCEFNAQEAYWRRDWGIIFFSVSTRLTRSS